MKGVRCNDFMHEYFPNPVTLPFPSRFIFKILIYMQEVINFYRIFYNFEKGHYDMKLAKKM